jgi:hypothetical protein
MTRLASSTAFILLDMAEDGSYGYSEENPIKVGGAMDREGPLNEYRFLHALAGPNGEPVSFTRLGSCCQFETKNGIAGIGLLDRYEVRWEGLKEPLILYLNMYDAEELKVPLGFSARK